MKIAEYLLSNEQFSITEKRKIFAIRNRMVNIENNFRGKNIKKNCICGNIEDMKHIYSCKIFNIKDKNIEYENIYGEDIRTIREVYQIFQKNLEKREQHLKQNNSPRIPGRVDPLYNDLYSNGNKLID